MIFLTILGFAVVDPTFRTELAQDWQAALERYHFGPTTRWERERIAELAGLLADRTFAEKLELIHRQMCPVWPCCENFRVSTPPAGEKA